MIRGMLKGMVALVLMFAATLGAMRAQPYDDGGLWAQLAPPGCAAPCFLGIRPGTTTGDEARTILRAHPWIGTIYDETEGISWAWNGEQPAFVSNFSKGFLLGSIDLHDGVVAAIHVQTSTIWASFFSVFGAPDRVVLLTERTPSTQYRIHDASYVAHDFEIETTTRCPITSRMATWYSIVYVTWPVSGPILNSQRRLARSC